MNLEAIKNISAFDRLDVIRKYQEAWQHPAPQSRTYELTGDSFYDICGGVFAREDQNGLSVTSLPSITSKQDVETWHHEDLGITVEDLAIDPRQDLLVFALKSQSPF